jgi:hypothetical protein
MIGRCPSRPAGRPSASAGLYGLGRTMPVARVLSWARHRPVQVVLAATPPASGAGRRRRRRAVHASNLFLARGSRGGWPRKPMQAAVRVAGSRNRSVRATLIITAAAAASAAGVLSGCQLRVPCELAGEAVRVAQLRLSKGPRGKAGRMLLRRGNLVGAIPPRPGL